ncbi:MAG: hypothetical protein AcusKO_02070 [Acuticoccus sp.]
MRSLCLGLFTVALVLALVGGGAGAAPSFPLEPADTSSPSDTYHAFLEAIEDAYTAGQNNDRDQSQRALERAVHLLDTSKLPPRFVNGRGMEAALMMKEVLDKLERPHLEEIPDDDDGDVTRWRVPKTEIAITRQTEGPRAGEYLFSAETVANMRSYHRKVRHLPAVSGNTPDIYSVYLATPGHGLAQDWSEHIPGWMKQTYMGQAAWQWIATALVLAVAVLLSGGLIMLGGALDGRGAATPATPVTPAEPVVRRPRRTSPARMLSLVAATFVIFAAQYIVDETINLTGIVLEVVTYILDATGYVLLGWLVVLLIMNLAYILIRLRGLDPGAATGRLARLGAAGLSVLVVVALFVQAGQDFGLPAYSIVTGLGVGGIAIGFGAQTLVRDIFSGIFFLVDDAFRPGEYIDTGAGKGFVERVSIRSVQLRHHNGPLQTIPFGEIKKVNNFSRDWVVMKLSFRLPFGTDTENVRKLIKKLGQELLEDPEVGDKFIEPLKSQGIYDVDDFGIIMRVKFMTRPGEQFTLRRMVNLRIQELFKREGIEFAGREVRVHGESSARDVAGSASEIGADVTPAP